MNILGVGHKIVSSKVVQADQASSAIQTVKELQHLVKVVVCSFKLINKPVGHNFVCSKVVQVDQTSSNIPNRKRVATSY